MAVCRADTWGARSQAALGVGVPACLPLTLVPQGPLARWHRPGGDPRTTLQLSSQSPRWVAQGPRRPRPRAVAWGLAPSDLREKLRRLLLSRRALLAADVRFGIRV